MMCKTIETQEEYDKLSQLSMSEVGLKKDMDELQKMLLNYRRKNKIYEVGDYVVGVNVRSYGSDVIRIKSFFNFHGEPCFEYEGDYYTGDDNLSLIRHATDDEIKLNKRIN